MRVGITMDKQKAIQDEFKNIGVVIDDGRIKALKKGTAYIRVKARDGSGKYATCKVTVKN